MKKLISMIITLAVTVGCCGASLYAYSQKTAIGGFSYALKERFVENTSGEKLASGISALSNFFIARPRAYLRQHGATSGAPDAVAVVGQIADSGQGEPMIIDRVPITARIQVVYLPKKISLSFTVKPGGSTDRQIAAAGRINDS